MLITLLLVADGVLAKPWLYMSLHFKQHRQLYYEKLQRVRTHGDWEGWLAFYLEGVQTVAERATATLEALLLLFRDDREKVQSNRGDSAYQRSATLSNLKVFEHLREKLMLNIPETAAACSLTKPTVKRVLDDLAALGIVQETTGGARNRVYLYKKYLDLLNQDTLDPRPMSRPSPS
jgi:Fic family protein